ncbi:STAS domain-containing protein [Nonomuraea bangladeshensis]|uniref:STAS domain-containing protein n=1 Tax=Nonomuraea bangladeshensis TaxID=404385 RepID=UPI0031DA686D
MSGTDPARLDTEDFSITVRDQGAVLLIQLTGPLAGPSVDSVRMYVDSALVTHSPPEIVLDVGALTCCDQAGYGIIRVAADRARASGGRLLITRGSHVFPDDLDDLDDLETFPTLRDALRELGRSQTHEHGDT